VLRDGLRLVEQREAEGRQQAEGPPSSGFALGVGALDQGEFKEFRNTEDLQAYFERPLGEGHFQGCWVTPNGRAEMARPPRTREWTFSVIFHFAPDENAE